MQKELTPTEIASMSEVLAKYMGVTVERLYPENKKEGQSGLHFTFPKDMKLPYSLIYRNCSMESIRYHSSWDWIHEVWEKVSSEEVDGMNQYWYQIELAICGNDIQEAFWALHRAITFINNLKQQNENNKSI
ncbi:hypothetical protein UFOVP129_85 [uncultured Caudovirales phage]|uniref:Uncharacterized protein n=1 Tax=uncultured Caudovirales phage TaxID=2100421 RepID=A0A6J5LE00_9CAUD|nr:hypothetical protein UFOVP129_85 [uncultured Caudovirales phage]